MTKEEILEKSRQDNGGKDIEDLEVQKSAAMAGYFSSFGLCLFVTAISLIFARKVNYECWMIFFGMLSVAFFVKFFKLRKGHELFVAICYLVLFILFTVITIFELTGRLPSSAGAA